MKALRATTSPIWKGLQSTPVGGKRERSRGPFFAPRRQAGFSSNDKLLSFYRVTAQCKDKLNIGVQLPLLLVLIDPRGWSAPQGLPDAMRRLPWEVGLASWASQMLEMASWPEYGQRTDAWLALPAFAWLAARPLRRISQAIAPGSLKKQHQRAGMTDPRGSWWSILHFTITRHVCVMRETHDTWLSRWRTLPLCCEGKQASRGSCFCSLTCGGGAEHSALL